MADRVCMTCKYYENELDENGEDKCMNCMYGSVPNNSKNPYPNWEAKEKKESEWYVEAIKEGLKQAEEKQKVECTTCLYYDWCRESGNKCTDCDAAHSADGKNPYPNWEPKKSGCKDKEAKKSGRYPWREVKDKNIYTYAGWVHENMANRDPLLTLEEIHIYMDLMLKANIADELHHLNKILERRKGWVSQTRSI